MILKLFNASYLSLSAQNFGTLIELNRSTLAAEVIFHFLVLEALFTSLTGKLDIAECLKCETVNFLCGYVFVATIWTVFGFLKPFVDAGLTVELLAFGTHRRINLLSFTRLDWTDYVQTNSALKVLFKRLVHSLLDTDLRY